MAHQSDEKIQLTPAIRLLDYLKNLDGEELKEFKWHLSHITYNTSKSIPEGQVKDLKERTDVVDLMINFYCEDGALKVMLEILRQMNQNNLVLKLNKDLQKSNQTGGELDRVTGQCAQMDQHESDAKNVGERYRDVQRELKNKLKQKCQCISEGIAKQGKSTFLIDIYTELYITEAGSGGVNNEHEIRQIETACWKNSSPEHAIKCSDIFKPLPGQRKHIRTVLTKGIAGIGKTVSVQKFVLDWAEGRENQDIEFIFTFPFCDLNRLKEKQYSLIELIYQFFSEIKEIENIKWNKTVFIFDGLDECRLPLKFNDNEIWNDETKQTTVDILLTNLIAGNLLSSALIWITSRPAAANQIPYECIQQLTEVRGFNDTQKEQYFIKRFSNQTMSNKIFAYIKSSRTLFIMCHIPIFCWISATVLEQLLGKEVSKEIPQTLTQMYSHFLIIQIIKNRKYQENCVTNSNSKMLSMEDREIILKLGKLSFHALEKGNLIFYKEDLESCGIKASEATMYSHLCTEIIIEEWGMYQEKVYRFVHLSLQEYLAALYAFYLCTQEKINVLDPDSGAEEQETLSALHKSAIDKALQSQNGHLDLFLRFILGLSLESNETFLQGLLMSKRNANWTAEDTVKYIKMMIKEEFSPDRIINLFHCLNEINDHSLVKEIQTYLKTRKPTDTKLKAYQCSALAFVLLMSGEVLDDFDLKTYNASDLGLERLLPVVRHCRRAVLDSCGLRDSSYETVASALQVANHLRELNLSYNVLGDSGLRHLDPGLRSPNCRLQKLLLSGCHFTGAGCEVLASALGSNPSCPRELDLSYNDVGDRGVLVLCDKLKSLSCKLENLKLGNCCLTELCCGDLSLLLCSASSELRELELRDNDLRDSGVKLLCGGLEDANCKLQRLSLSGCRVTEEGCGFLSRALRSNPSHMRELDLSYNHPGDSGLTLISAVQEDPSCGLKRLFVDHCEESRDRPRLQKYFCSISLDPLTAHRCLSLSDKDQKVTFVKEVEELYPDHPERFVHEMQVLSREALSDRSYWEVRISGVVDVGMAYRGIPRKNICDGFSALEMSDKSWCLHCLGMVPMACHNGKMTSMQAPGSMLQTVGVYLDHQAGTLSFYSVSSDTITHIHSFRAEFTEPLHAGIRLFRVSTSFASLQP